eukprot:199825-Chlamydomonas_euryale.AAC.2
MSPCPSAIPRAPLHVPVPLCRYQLHGITRSNVLALCQRHGIPHREADFSLTQVRRWRLLAPAATALCGRCEGALWH